MRARRLVVSFLVAGCVTVPAAAPPDSRSEPDVAREPAKGFDPGRCTFDGHPLYGRIRIVRALADVKVEVVTAFPDVRVRKVDAFADECGEWEIVDGVADTTVELVDALGDVKVEFVEAFPGVP